MRTEAPGFGMQAHYYISCSLFYTKNFPRFAQGSLVIFGIKKATTDIIMPRRCRSSGCLASLGVPRFARLGLC